MALRTSIRKTSKPASTSAEPRVTSTRPSLSLSVHDVSHRTPSIAR
jgi:hypothetical protein